MTDILVAMFAFLIIATCARSDTVRGIGLLFSVVFIVIAVTVWIVGILVGLVT